MKAFVSRHRTASLSVALAGIACLVFVALYFEPQALFIDKKVSEAAPSAASSGPANPGSESAGVQTVAGGEFRGLEHPGSGRALIVTAGDKTFLRFEDLQVDNGPDLKVYLSRAAADGPDDALDDDFEDLGELKGNIGDQNYELPPTVDPAEFKSAVVWCKRFAVGFAVAPLQPN